MKSCLYSPFQTFCSGLDVGAEDNDAYWKTSKYRKTKIFKRYKEEHSEVLSNKNFAIH